MASPGVRVLGSMAPGALPVTRHQLYTAGDTCEGFPHSFSEISHLSVCCPCFKGLSPSSQGGGRVRGRQTELSSCHAHRWSGLCSQGQARLCQRGRSCRPGHCGCCVARACVRGGGEEGPFLPWHQTDRDIRALAKESLGQEDLCPWETDTWKVLNIKKRDKEKFWCPALMPLTVE